LTVLNLLNSWLPTLVDTTGLPHEQALRIASSFQFGGMVGVISMGVLADRIGFFRVLPVAFLVGSTCVGLVGAGGFALSDRHSRHRGELGARNCAHLLDRRSALGRLPAQSRMAAAIHLS